MLSDLLMPLLYSCTVCTNISALHVVQVCNLYNVLKVTLKEKIILCTCRVNGEDVRLMLWDTAGQEEFDAITKAYYRGNRLLIQRF